MVLVCHTLFLLEENTWCCTIFTNLEIFYPVAFDEDLEGELAENHDTQTEISMLATSPNPELSEVRYLII